MGRTWRKNSDYGVKRDAKDRQRLARRQNKRVQKIAKKLGKDDIVLEDKYEK